MPDRPNILFVLADNLGWGELGCYGGGILRGAPTPRIDRLAAEGLRFLNFNVESDCVPTRSALMTGRHPIRTGALQSVPAGLPQGIHPSEITLAQILAQRGYATAIFGKWHLGDRPGRLPTDRGFDEWYGIPRSTNESLFSSTPEFDPSVATLPVIMESRRGDLPRVVRPYDLEARRLIDSELTARAADFMRRSHHRRVPFFAYVPFTQLHYPTLPHPRFAGRTAAGDFADSMVEMDCHVGELLDSLEDLGLGGETLVLFGSDNGPEFRRPWRGTAGPWTGTYHTAMEGALRVPFIMRWPGRIASGRETNDIVHIVDLFATLARVGGGRAPVDRPIDGVDQLDFITGRASASPREGFVFYIKDELRAVKWRNWKMHFIWETEPNCGPIRLETPYIFNLIRDPKEQTSVTTEENWVRGPMLRLLSEFRESLRVHPPIPPGAPDEFAFSAGREPTA